MLLDCKLSVTSNLEIACYSDARAEPATLCGPQNLYGMSPANYYARCNPSPLAGVAQGVVRPNDTVPAGKTPPGQARDPSQPCLHS